MDESLIEKQNGNFANTVLGAVPSVVYNEDCVEALKRFSDNYFDLAIVDPPYGLGKRLHNGSSSSPFIKSQALKINNWDNEIPTVEYFNELKRVSKNQIIWGGNYFAEYLGNFRCFLYWDKTIHGNSYSDGEMAWTSFDKPVRYFRQNIATITSEGRIHPTQKSIILYKWILNEFAKEGDLILDTHVGSGSSRIACNELNFSFTGFEIDKDYYEAQEKRFKDFVSQLRMF